MNEYWVRRLVKPTTKQQRVESRVIQCRPASLRDRLNLLEAYDDVDFYYRFRVKIEGFLLILQAVEPLLPQYRKQTNSPLSPVQQLSVAQRFFATGDLQISCGDIHQAQRENPRWKWRTRWRGRRILLPCHLTLTLRGQQRRRRTRSGQKSYIKREWGCWPCSKSRWQKGMNHGWRFWRATETIWCQPHPIYHFQVAFLPSLRVKT